MRVLYVCVHVCRRAHIHLCSLRPEGGIGCLPQSIHIFLLVFLDTVFPWTWSSLSLPVSPRDPPISSSALGYRHTLAYRHWTWVLGIPTQVPMLSWQDDRVITSALKFRTFKIHIVHKILTRELQTSPRSSYPSLKKKTACYFFISSYFSRGKKRLPSAQCFGKLQNELSENNSYVGKKNFIAVLTSDTF